MTIPQFQTDVFDRLSSLESRLRSIESRQAAWASQFVVKPSDTTLSARTNLFNDPHLLFEMTANGVWLVRIGLHVVASVDGSSNVKVAITIGTGAVRMIDTDSVRLPEH